MHCCCGHGPLPQVAAWQTTFAFMYHEGPLQLRKEVICLHSLGPRGTFPTGCSQGLDQTRGRFHFWWQRPRHFWGAVPRTASG
jgi:hypothetical protein